ncbi:uncharacterized protein MONBRDRAFT_12981 [Monosiga brevicollis MX1]|uniref:Alpha-L-rhamnosidase n=1 Tax=Monosiga brevicollis TaxID=81824 RepID=A9VDX3_MONBE|nr:uncharacterized protein MONBRDRAFT_12981 [Monosiga brevicollis MX1]EDQ84278.1 predicted protein [Monosiga brevicollis MX1]|eukprot:XP_001750908.1 hypothetical protein [Monosiga brevicollis MX1]
MDGSAARQFNSSRLGSLTHLTRARRAVAWGIVCVRVGGVTAWSSPLLLTTQPTPDVWSTHAVPVWLNDSRLGIEGTWLTMGPGRSTCPNANTSCVLYDTLDVSLAMMPATRGQPVTVALQSYHATSGAQRVALALIAHLPDGTQTILALDDSWKAWNADSYFNPGPSIGPTYTQPQENLMAAAFPLGWTKSGFADAHWNAPVLQSPWAEPPQPKTTPPLLFETGAQARVSQIDTYTWAFDFATEIMAGFQVQLNAPAHSEFIVRLGEELTDAKGHVLDPMRTGNNYTFLWSMPPDAETGYFEMHDYVLFRYGTIQCTSCTTEKVPSPNIEAWSVRYPFDVNATTFAGYTHHSDPPGVLLHVHDQSYLRVSCCVDSLCRPEPLQSLWQLAHNTVIRTSLDTMTDSNTRERLPYEGDAYITAMLANYFTDDYLRLSAAAGQTNASLGPLAANLRRGYNAAMLDTSTCLYRDGVNVSHAAVHSTYFAIWLGMANGSQCEPDAAALWNRTGMIPSVYGALAVVGALAVLCMCDARLYDCNMDTNAGTWHRWKHERDPSDARRRFHAHGRAGAGDGPHPRRHSPNHVLCRWIDVR